MRTDVLTYGERLLLQRRRRGQSQRQAASAYGVTRYRYRAWELDDNGKETGPLPPRAPLGRMHPHEACFILRRRKGLSVERLARRLRVTPEWLTQMEHGAAPVDRLARFWSSRGRSRAAA